MRREHIGDLLLKFSRKQRVLQSEYAAAGETPIVDQSSGTLVVGYTDNHDARHEAPLPVTVFGDHTRVVKYVDFPFASGADGTQLLYPNTPDLDPTYFFYAVRNVDLSNYFYARHFKFLKEQQINIPALKVQHRIAETLKSYDDLIYNNRRRMALLEAAARHLYREWFVRLRFPGHEHTRLFSGLPEGWYKVPLGQITTKIGSGFTPRGGETSYLTEGTPLIRSLNVYDDRFQEEGLAFVSEDHATALAGVTVESKDILLNITGASVARCCMAPERYLPARVNQHVMIIRIDPEKTDAFFVHKAINSDERKRQLLSYAQKGSTREALTKEMIAGFEITLPSDALMRQFGEIAEPSFRQSELLALQNEKLRAARDLLLSRLMSGEVSV